MAQSSIFKFKSFEGPEFKINLAALECNAGDTLVVHMPNLDVTYTPECMHEFHEFVMKNFTPSKIIYTSSDNRTVALEVIRTVCTIEGE